MYCIIAKRFNDIEKVYGPYNSSDEAHNELKKVYCKSREYTFLIQEIKATDNLFDFIDKINHKKSK